MKHKTKRIVAAAISFACTAAVTVSLVPTIAVTAAVTAKTTDYLNLREGAGIDKKVILTLSKGVAVTILDNSNATWAKVQTASGKQGYCSKQYLSIPGSGATNSPSVSGTASTAVTTDRVNLRAGAGTSTKIMATLPIGTSLKVMDASNPAWVKVQTSDGRQGYCSTQYIRILAASSGGVASGNTSSGSSSSASITAVTTDYLNLRQGAGTNFKVLVTISKGTALTVLDNSNPSWAKVQTPDGKQGYCSKQYLTFKNNSSSGSSSGTPSNSGSSSNSSTSGSVTAKTTSNLNVRSGAGTSFGIVMTLLNGTSVTVLDNSNAQWVKIKTSDGKTGYCSKEFLQITDTGSNTNPNPDPGTGTGADTGTDTPPDVDTGSDNGSDSHTITGASVTADMLRLRQDPSTSAKILANLPRGTSLKVLDTSNSSWTKVQTSSGLTGYVSSEYIQIHYSDDPSNASSLSLSTTSSKIPAGKTLYIKANVSPSGTYINWTSSNNNVATVSNGYVSAVSTGTAVITASSGSYKATCNITVTSAEPVRTAFASPNIASTGAAVTLTAVTDTSRDAVQFVIQSPDGTKQTVNADSCTNESCQNVTTKKWTATTTFYSPGTYTFTAYSSQNGNMSTTGFTSNAYVSSQQDFSTTTSEERRVSDQMIALIAKWEGYSPTVYADQLTANQVPTIGYGCTFGANAVFYNNLTETEAWSLLVNKINNSSYTTELNKMIKNNHFLMNQNQADCLISFAYNVGAGYFNTSSQVDFRTIMRNAVVPPTISGSLAATVTKDTVVRSEPSINGSEVCSISNGASIDVTDTNFSNPKDGWYKVRASNGSEGWVNSGYVCLSNADSLTHDLNYTNAYAMGTEMLRWSQAGGKFYTGLFYRRLGEVNVYNYGDYDAVRYNKYSYTYPSGAAGLS
ncbi:SH3 domain-containing protein [Caproiciproducens galactitolivorans]|uniref:Lysozyme n=1 Tax=Caproiciproducens galactitolivorans TaxID=642589 RepID=A0A4Z0Y2D0_9FIRM|nr:SH3 domain-containing protein [Caproiciproducens galactitolivorans]QEY34359.1 SH3 domain-containing protein [Caproiciproducens galactitolivorans]TGJ77874.1 cell wall-binding protein YwsB precursor [Caproiciproducens galactitolivorans]